MKRETTLNKIFVIKLVLQANDWLDTGTHMNVAGFPNYIFDISFSAQAFCAHSAFLV